MANPRPYFDLMSEQRATSPEAVRQTYDRLAHQYDKRWSFYVDATLRATLEVICLDASDRVLDLACGTGALEERISRQSPSVRCIGVDVSFAMLRQASAKSLAKVTGWCQAEGSRLPFHDSAFDLVICANSFHYFSEPSTVLAQVHRLLRPGGTFVLVDWCDDYWTCKLCSLWLRRFDPAFHRTYSLKACDELLRDAHFDILQARRFRISWLWGLMRFVCVKPNAKSATA